MEPGGGSLLFFTTFSVFLSKYKRVTHGAHFELYCMCHLCPIPDYPANHHWSFRRSICLQHLAACGFRSLSRGADEYYDIAMSIFVLHRGRHKLMHVSTKQLPIG
jgi:hypothetical protein